MNFFINLVFAVCITASVVGGQFLDAGLLAAAYVVVRRL